jgi:glycine cleavage system aminomethyltransferase T
VPARVFRMSFTGEAGYEINVPADYGRMVWEAIHERGRRWACAYGTETMHVLRAEKGYIIVGQDTDGTVTPHDAGLSWAVGKKKTGFRRHSRHEAPGSRRFGPRSLSACGEGSARPCLRKGRRSSPIRTRAGADDDDRSG